MYSYVALTWNEEGEQAHAAAELQQQLKSLHDFQLVASSPRLFIVQKSGLRSACGACLLPAGNGAVLGTLFSSTSGEAQKRRLAIDSNDAAAIAATGGMHLLVRFWGRYVAFVRNPRTGCHAVIRDPSGMLPCFQTTHRGVQIWFSHLRDLAPLGLPEPRIDWRYVQAHVVSGLMRSRQTGLSGIHEVLAGERWEVANGEARRDVVWNPAAISSTDVIEDSAAAADQLRSVTKACVDAWASAYGGILHLLSGGLDSSIVAALLGQSPSRTPTTCTTSFSVDAETDERFYARLAARKAGFKLLERRLWAKDVDLRSILKIAITPRPWHYRYAIEHSDYEATEAHAEGAAAIFTGGGGDGIFYKAEFGHSVADYIHRHGLTSRLPAVALNAARLEGKSLLKILWRAFSAQRPGTHRTTTATPAALPTLVSKRTFAAHAALQVEHGSKREELKIPLGKQTQILNTCIPPAFYDQFDDPRALERIPPLVSQPIVELCLRIPTYLLVSDGWDRALARRAFANDLPAEIVSRRGKGGLQNHALSIFRSNIQFLREFMLDGELATHGVLDRGGMERCLSGRGPVSGHEFMEIQDHLSTEAWIRSHTGGRRGSSAV